MNEHVLDEVVDYVEGRMTPERMEQVRRHLEQCAECAADFAFTRELREEAMHQGLRHLDPARIVALASEEGDSASENERSHLNSCNECREELEWARTLPSADEVLRREGAQKKVVPLRRPAGVWLLAAATVVALFMIPRLTSRNQDVSRFVRIEPLPVGLDRGASPSGEFERERLDGLERYAEGNWSGAIGSFRRALELQPDSDEIRLYLGSAELLAGNSAEAVDLLRPAAERASGGRIHDEARWLYANALLAVGRARDAERVLSQIAEEESDHSDAAESLLEQLR